MTLEEKIEFLQNENARLLARALEAEHRRAIAEKQYSNLLMKLNDLKGTDLIAYPWELRQWADQDGHSLKHEALKDWETPVSERPGDTVNIRKTEFEDNHCFTWHDLIDNKKRGSEWNTGNGLN